MSGSQRNTTKNIALVNLETTAPSETRSLGRRLGELLPTPSIVGIDGPLGVGKTCLVQGVAEGLGIPSTTLITSPAYTLVQEYPLHDRCIIHADFYRLDALAIHDFVLFEELFANPHHVILVEWASKFLSDLASSFLTISISKGADENHRILNFFSDSGLYFPLLKDLQAHANSNP